MVDKYVRVRSDCQGFTQAGVPVSSADSCPGWASVGETGRLGEPRDFTFLFCFDMLSIFERKNPLGLIEAFRNAFQPDEGPILIIKVINGELEKNNLARLRLAASSRSDIVIVDEYLDHVANLAMISSCDCYISLHRSEGFGLTLAEAMSFGKPVIATGYSGNLDFMTPDTSYLVPWVWGKVPPGCQPYPAGVRWAEPDLAAAVELMREVYERRSESARLGERAKAHVLHNHGLDVSAAFVTERVMRAQEELSRRTPPRRNRRREDIGVVDGAAPGHMGPGKDTFEAVRVAGSIG